MTALPDRLLIVTDRHQAVLPLSDQVTAALAGGARWIWLRDRDLPSPERCALAHRLRGDTARYGARLTVGHDIALAREVGADGVHLRSAGDITEARAQLGAGKLVGVSCHGIADVQAAAEAKADYVTLSPIFASASKPGYGPALGTAALQSAAGLGVPILALGGIVAENAANSIAAGCWGAAVMGPFMRTHEPSRLVQELRAALFGR